MATVWISKNAKQDGSASYQVRYKDPLTKKTKYYESHQRKKDAAEAGHKLRALLDGDMLPEEKKVRRLNPITFQQVGELLVEDWTTRVATGEMSPVTLGDYTVRVNRLSREPFAGKLLGELTTREVTAYRTQLSIQVSNATSNRYLFIIKQVCQKGMQENAIRKNPAAEIKYLSEKDHERDTFLLPDKLNRLIEAAREHRQARYLPAMICLGAEHGASRQEILSLRWENIKFDFQEHGLIRFHRTKNDRKRMEFLMSRTRTELLAWKEHQQWIRDRKKITPIGDLVFCRHNGNPIGSFRKAWGQVLDKAGITNFHFHDLRHTFCSNLLMSGADIKAVKEMIGHADIKMTDRYSHITASQHRYNQEQLEAFYKGGV